MHLHNLVLELQNTQWSQVALAILVGAVLGFIFVKLKLPIPAPPVLAGIAGIVGIWLGYVIGK